MKTLFTLVLLLGLFQLSMAQTKPELTFERGRIEQEGVNLRMKEAMALMQNYPESLEYLKKARTNNTFAGVFGFIGGYLIGYPLGQSIAGGDANWGMAGAGAAVILVALPFHSAFKKNTQMAIELYNQADYKTLNNDVQLNIGLVGNGIGLKVTF